MTQSKESLLPGICRWYMNERVGEWHNKNDFWFLSLWKAWYKNLLCTRNFWNNRLTKPKNTIFAIIFYRYATILFLSHHHTGSLYQLYEQNEPQHHHITKNCIRWNSTKNRSLCDRIGRHCIQAHWPRSPDRSMRSTWSENFWHLLLLLTSKDWRSKMRSLTRRRYKWCLYRMSSDGKNIFSRSYKTQWRNMEWVNKFLLQKSADSEILRCLLSIADLSRLLR